MLEIKNLQYSIANHQVFQDFSIHLSSGTYGLIGQNGSGKTTFLKLVAGFLMPKSGHISRPSKPIYIGNGKLGFLEDMLVQDYMKFAMKVFGGNESELKEFIKVTGLDCEPKKLIDLSLGNKQKILLMPLFFGESQMYLLDESFGGIDQQSKNRILEHINNKVKKFIMVSHDIDDMIGVVDHFLLLQDGKIKQISANELMGDYKYIFSILQKDGMMSDKEFLVKDLREIFGGIPVSMRMNTKDEFL